MSTVFGADEAAYTVPDAIEPVRAWRAYGVSRDERNLVSMVHRGEILPGEAFHATCHHEDHEAPSEHCSCGVYAARDLPTLIQLGYGRSDCVIAEVNLWGRIIPAEKGYRAEFVYPYRLYSADADLRDELAIRYGVECLPLGDEIADAEWAFLLKMQTEQMRSRRIARAREARVQAALDAWREGRPGGRVPHPAHYSEARGNFGALIAWIKAGRSGHSRPYRNNTTLEIIDGRICMRLHATIVASWDGGEGFDSVQFDTGGWDTVTTRERMNDACGLFGIGGRVGSDSYYMPRRRVAYAGGSYTESTGRLRYWPAGWYQDMPAQTADGRTREGRAQVDARRAWIREHCPAID